MTTRQQLSAGRIATVLTAVVVGLLGVTATPALADTGATVDPSATVTSAPTPAPVATTTPVGQVTSNTMPANPAVYTSGQVKAVDKGRRLSVDIDPDWTGGPYQVTISKLSGSKTAVVKRLTLSNTRHSALVALAPGRYQVLVAEGSHWSAWMSRPVTLTR